MDFETFKKVTAALIEFYAVTPPEHLLQTGSVLSNSISRSALLLALFEDLEKIISTSNSVDDDSFSSAEWIEYIQSIEKQFVDRFYSE